MNQYGSQAMAHWERWLPARYAAIPDPRGYFEALGRQVEAQIVQLSSELAGEDPPGESYLNKVGRLNEARARAEEMVMREEVLLPPEPATNEKPPEPDMSEEPPPDQGGPWIPVAEDMTSPYWAEVRERERQANESPPR